MWWKIIGIGLILLGVVAVVAAFIPGVQAVLGTAAAIAVAVGGVGAIFSGATAIWHSNQHDHQQQVEKDNKILSEENAKLKSASAQHNSDEKNQQTANMLQNNSHAQTQQIDVLGRQLPQQLENNNKLVEDKNKVYEDIIAKQRQCAEQKDKEHEKLLEENVQLKRDLEERKEGGSNRNCSISCGLSRKS